MPKEYFKKKGQSNSFKMSNPYGPPLKHLVRDNPEHQETYGDHSDDLQTDAEHDKPHLYDFGGGGGGEGGEGTRTHWPDGTERTEREIFDWDETHEEETKEATAPTKILDPTADPSIMSQQGTVGTLGGGMNTAVDPNAPMGGGMFYKSSPAKDERSADSPGSVYHNTDVGEPAHGLKHGKTKDQIEAELGKPPK